MKKAILYTMFFGVISVAVIIILNLKQKPEIEIKEDNAVYINTIEELNQINGFRDIKLKVTGANVNAADIETSVKCLEIEKKGETVCKIASVNSEKDGTSVLPSFMCSTKNEELSCVFLLNSQGFPNAVMLSQQKPAGLVSVWYDENGRWCNLRYHPLRKTEEDVKKKFYDVYVDIDFDGYFDSRFVQDSISNKTLKCYVMLGMDWKEMQSVLVNQDVPEAIEQDGTVYKFVGDSWVKDYQQESPSIETPAADKK